MFIIVMGVSGCGKSTTGQQLARRLNWTFYDGDDFHPAANIQKMAAGQPLTDEDRTGWLDALSELIRSNCALGENGVLACSALKAAYRQKLSGADPEKVAFVYLQGSYEQILARMQSRSDHFMKPAMLQSQFAALEQPTDALTIDTFLPQDEIMNIIIDNLPGWQHINP